MPRGECILTDFGDSDHMVPRMEWLTELRHTAPRNVVLGDGTKIRCNVSGTLKVFASEAVTHEGREIVPNYVLYAPQLS